MLNNGPEVSIDTHIHNDKYVREHPKLRVEDRSGKVTEIYQHFAKKYGDRFTEMFIQTGGVIRGKHCRRVLVVHDGYFWHGKSNGLTQSRNFATWKSKVAEEFGLIF